MVFFTHGRCLLATLLIASPCRAANETADKWWEAPFGMYQTNLREIDADMDVDQVADAIQQHGATAWLTSVGGILANYPTDLDFHIRNPYLDERESGDLIQDSLDAARARDIRLLARMDFSKVQLSVAEDHPEWLYISPNSTWQNHTNNLVSVCPSGGWYQERVFDILDEVTTRYELDGFFVNWAGFNERDYYRVYHGVCHCDSCQERWADYTDSELPDGPWSDTYDEWKEFSDGIIDEWTGRVRDFIAERLPGAGLILGESADIMFHESNNAVDRVIWHHATAETVSKHKTHRPEVPVLVNSASFLDHAYRISAEDPAQFVQYHLQAISRGANPSTYIIGIPGRIPWPGNGLAAEIVTFHQQFSDIYAGLRPVAKTGLVLPQESQMNETQYEQSSSEYQGLYKSLQELHVPFDIVAHEDIADISENGGLERYDVVILPDLGKLKSEDAEILDAWVAAGGTLITTGEVGVDGDDDALQLQSLPASQRLEWHTDSEEIWSMYFAPEQNRTEEHYYEGPIIPLLHTYGVYEWADEAEGLYKKLDFAPFAPPEYIYGNTQVDERGVGWASFENGTGALVPWPVGRGYREIGLSSFRDFFGLILSEIGAEEPFEIEIAPQVEVTVNKNDQGQTVVHLVNMSGVRKQNFGAHLPIPGGSIKFSEDVEGISARTLVTNLELEVVDGEISLPGIDLFDVVVIEGL